MVADVIVIDADANVHWERVDELRRTVLASRPDGRVELLRPL
jgi:hypothetical protein